MSSKIHKNTFPDWVSRAESLNTLVRQYADEAEQIRHLPNEVASAFVDHGLYRLGAPVSVGGADERPATQMAVIESISHADGSAGWNLMIGIETFALVSPSMSSCIETIADRNIVMASSTAAVGTATRCKGGWLINGQWQFVSGVHNAQVFGATVMKEEEPDKRYYAILPKGRYEILDTWHVAGLRGSGSHDVLVENQVVPDTHLVATLGKGSMPSNQLKIPLGVRLTCNKVAVALGIARAGIDAFLSLANEKTPRASNRKLKDRPFAQRQLAKAEARLRTVRSAAYQHTEYLTDICFNEEPLNDQDIAIAHLLAIEASKGCVDVVDSLLQAAGSTANFIGQPLERISRDVRVVRQHITVAPQHIDDIGRALMGEGLRGFLRM